MSNLNLFILQQQLQQQEKALEQARQSRISLMADMVIRDPDLMKSLEDKHFLDICKQREASYEYRQGVFSQLQIMNKL